MKTKANTPCPCCQALPSQPHRGVCSVERCPHCGGQLLTHTCGRRVRAEERMPWGGEWPGDAECREFGWYAKFVPGAGWVPCDKGQPGATLDLNRLYREAAWDRTKKRFVRK